MTAHLDADDRLSALVRRVRSGDLDACREAVEATEHMVLAVAFGVLRNHTSAEDAAQQAYLTAFRRLDQLDDPAAFAGWLRRIVITVALNMRRARRATLLRLDDVPDMPILDERETHWTEAQRLRLAAALLTLSPEERRTCDRRYYGRWSVARLAEQAGVEDAAMRKRLQRIRDKLRREMEMTEQRAVNRHEFRDNLPAKVVELLARPQLSDLPENPVGRMLEALRGAFPEFVEQALPEIIDLSAARATIAKDAMYVDPIELHRVNGDRILRYDLTLPLLMTVRFAGAPLRVWASGKAYRVCQADSKHLEAFHQAEALWLDERDRLDQWQVTARVLQSVDRVLPGRIVKIVPTEFPMCRQAWEFEIENDGEWTEVLAWGIFTDRIVEHLGADPARCAAVGVGYGLERLAMVRYGIDDIRKVDVASVA